MEKWHPFDPASHLDWTVENLWFMAGDSTQVTCIYNAAGIMLAVFKLVHHAVIQADVIVIG